jgi:DNA-binding XRE family transcriptional regulator
MLKSIRKKYDLKQYQLAALLGVSRPFVCMIELERRKMPSWIPVELKKVFGDRFFVTL